MSIAKTEGPKTLPDNPIQKIRLIRVIRGYQQQIEGFNFGFRV